MGCCRWFGFVVVSIVVRLCMILAGRCGLSVCLVVSVVVVLSVVVLVVVGSWVLVLGCSVALLLLLVAT